MLLAASLGVLTATHVVKVWMVVVLSFLNGAALSFDQPTRGALVPELVPKEELLGALSLQSVVFTGAGAIGPALAGFSVAAIGYAGNFFVNAMSYLAVLAALVAMKTRPSPSPARTPSPRAIAEALLAVRSDAALPLLLVLFASVLFFGPSPALLLPVMATRVLHVGSAHVGVLFASTGAGAVLGGLALASAGDPQHKGRIVLSAALLWAGALVGFACTRTFALALATLLLLGAFQVGVTATTVTLLQTRVPPTMRGRVMSLNTLVVMGVRPLGDFAAAAVIAAAGAPHTAIACALIVAVIAAAVATRGAVRNA
jgi:MFS family permease